MRHLAARLLNLAQQDASASVSGDAQDFHLNVTAVNCVEQLIHLANKKDIDLGMERQESVQIHSQEAAVQLFTAIDNAIKYTGAGHDPMCRCMRRTAWR